jgi:hypothetical protein
LLSICSPAKCTLKTSTLGYVFFPPEPETARGQTVAAASARWTAELLRQPLLATVVAQVFNFFEVLENVDLYESKSSMRRHTPGRVLFEVSSLALRARPSSGNTHRSSWGKHASLFPRKTRVNMGKPIHMPQVFLKYLRFLLAEPGVSF